MKLCCHAGADNRVYLCPDHPVDALGGAERIGQHAVGGQNVSAKPKTIGPSSLELHRVRHYQVIEIMDGADGADSAPQSRVNCPSGPENIEPVPCAHRATARLAPNKRWQSSKGSDRFAAQLPTW